MKKLIITCVLLTSVSLVASAQSAQTNTTASMQPPMANMPANPAADPTPKALTEDQLKVTTQTADNNTKILQKRVGFSKDQYAAIFKIEYRFQVQYDKFPANGKAVPRGLLSNITSERNNSLQQILSPDQYDKYLGKNLK